MFGAALRVGAAILPRAARFIPRIAGVARRLPVRRARGVIRAMAKLGAHAIHHVKRILPRHIGRFIHRIRGKFRPRHLPKPHIHNLRKVFHAHGLKSRIWHAAKKVGSVALWFAPVPSISTIKKGIRMIRKLGHRIRHIRRPSHGAAKAIHKIRRIRVVGGAKKLARRALKIARRHPIALGGIVGAGLLYRAMAHRRNKQNKRQSDVRDHLNPDNRHEGFFEKIAEKLKSLVKKPVEAAKKSVEAAKHAVEGAERAAEGIGGFLLLLGFMYALGRSRR